MAETILSPLVDRIFESLGSAALQELQLVWGMDVDEALQNLKSTLVAIQAVLEDAEERQFESKAVQDWLQKLKQVAYDADDLVDEIVTETHHSETAAVGKKKRKWRVWDYFSSLFNGSQRDMACRIREINLRLDKIAKERRDLLLETRCGSKQLEIIREYQRPSRSVSSVRDESAQVLGRSDEIEQIIKFLLSDHSNDRKFSVIGIVGMGGVGKTTLAQVVYNEKRVQENFELRAWVCASEQFDVERLTKEIIASASGSACDLSDIDSLQCCLRDKLNGKKFLLVIDDVWSDNNNDWERLQAPFTFGAKGSKIVITTRNQAASDTIQATCIHNLKCLSKQDCWALFVSQAFRDENINAYPDLLKIGEELIYKCGGLPLAAKALGGLLSSKRQVREWENILKSPIWDLRGPASNILPALRVSYQHLPAHLKRCFTFCSVFPKNYDFSKEKLVLLWVAHGFIHPEEGKQIEDVGSEYFNDLMLKSFFQLSCFTETAENVEYKMHGLFHDLAQFISGNECFHMEHGKSHGVLRKTRHSSYKVGIKESINFEPFYESNGLRTFLLLQHFKDVDDVIPHETFERLRFIRVLDLSWAHITELPNSIGNLKHLRYLDLSKTLITELPESICSIYNLQTLLLNCCYNLVELPDEMRRLINLRHLDLQGCISIICMPPQIEKFTCLQTLPRFIVGREKERGIANLKGLTDIRGKLGIEKLENVVKAEDAQQANLKNKPFVDHLSLMWSENRNHSSQNEWLEEEITDMLQPHPNLKTLAFFYYKGARFPSWMMMKNVLMLLSNLEIVNLYDCSRCNILPTLGCLPSLSCLGIYGAYEVKQIGDEFYGRASGFPSLKELNLHDMLNLDQWNESKEGHFPCLERLCIRNCLRLRQMPSSSLVHLTYLDISSCAMIFALPRLPSLTELRLDDLANLEEWSDVGKAHFPHLQRLRIHNCPKMMKWPSILPVITELDVSNCQGLDAFPLLPSLCMLQLGGLGGGSLLKSVPCLGSLASLTISNIASLKSVPGGMLQQLTQLKYLTIHNCEELVTLEEKGLHDEGLPSTLTSLSFIQCPNLKSLPEGLHTLMSLRTLTIYNCPHVSSFPEEGLPPLLQSLDISGCPMLKERCLKGR